MKTRNKVLSVLITIMMLCIISCVIIGCAKNPEDSGGGETPEQISPAADDFSYYPQLKMNADKKLYVVKDTHMTNYEKIVVTAIQGLLAREGAEIYIEAQDDQGSNSGYTIWLNDLVDNYGFTIEYLESDSASRAVDKVISKYIERTYQSGNLLVPDRGAVVYASAENVADDQLNVATTICAAQGYLPIEESLVEKATKSVAEGGWGLVVKEDLTQYAADGGLKNEEWAFYKYKDSLTKKILIHQDPQRFTLRDYAIAVGAYVFFTEASDDMQFITDVYQWADKDIPIMGWCEDELAFVAMNSGFSKITIGADHSNNLSTMSAIKPTQPIKQNKYTGSIITPNASKHYVAMVMSDGDNVQWVQSGFMKDERYFGSPYRGDFKMTWGINPSMSDLSPTTMQKVYNESTAKDEFITGVSGNGYINPTMYKSLNDYVSRTNAYMKRSDLKYVDLLDSGIQKEALIPFGQMPNIGGGVWKVGNKYVEGKGGVYWANDKPFITFRESMWGESPESMLALANRINHYQKAPNKIDGYTVINIHPWTHTMLDVKKFVNMLGEHIEIVTAGELIEMVKTNVPHTDVPTLEDVTIPPVEAPDYTLPGLTKEDLALLPVQTKKVYTHGDAASPIVGNWQTSGGVVSHTEGLCLEVATPSNDLASFVYSRHSITADNDKLQVSARAFVRPGETYSEIAVRVVKADGTVKTIKADGRPNTAEGDWITIDTDAYMQAKYDLSEFVGQTVTIAVGAKRGNHCAINEIRLFPSVAKMVFPNVSIDDVRNMELSTINTFSGAQINTDWVKKGMTALLGEGFDLQFAGENADEASPMNTFVYNKFDVVSTNKMITIKARTFVGQNGPTGNQDPQYIPILYVMVTDMEGNVKTLAVVGGDAKVDSDSSKTFEYDLSEYVGEAVGIAVGIGRGYHCAINEITLG